MVAWVDRLSSQPVSSCEVSTLDKVVWVDSVETGTFVGQLGLGDLALSHFPGAQGLEVIASDWQILAVELEGQSPKVDAVDSDVHEDLVVEIWL